MTVKKKRNSKVYTATRAVKKKSNLARGREVNQRSRP
jgi:hypothetical protein